MGTQTPQAAILEARYQDIRARYDAAVANRSNPFPTNAETSSMQVYEVVVLRPEHFSAYVDEAKRFIITWTGDPLAVIEAFGPVYTSNWGDRRRHVWARLGNGERYHGVWLFDNQDCINLTKLKA